MYHPISIAPLSESQISKALKGLPVRVSAGNQHDIEISTEQLKKFAKANKLGKALNITLDPFQIQNHMNLIGSGVNRLKKAQRWEQFANATVRDGIDTAGKAARVYYDSTNPMAQMGFGIGGNIKAVGKDSGKRLIISGTNRAIRAIDGSGMASDLFVRAHQKDAIKATNRYGLDSGSMDRDARLENDEDYYGYGIGGNIKAVGKDSGKRLIISGTERAIRAIDGSGVSGNLRAVSSGLGKVMTGSSVNRLKKGQRWEQFANATIRDGIDTAGKAARVYYDSTDPMAQMGFGLKKRGRPKKMQGSALYPAGVY